MAGRTITPSGLGGLEALRGLQRRARPGLHQRRPPSVPELRARRAHRGVGAVRPRRRCVQHLRRLVDGGRRRRVRRERGTALHQPTWPGCPPPPVASSSAAAPAGNLSALIAAPAGGGERAGRIDRVRGLIIGSSKGAHSRMHRRRLGRWTPTSCEAPADERGPDDVETCARPPSPASRPRTVSGCSPSSPPAAPPTPA